MWATNRDYLTPLDVLDMRTAGQKWNCAKLYGSVAALWFFLLKKDGREEGAKPEWPSRCRDHPKNSRAPCKARDEAGEWRKMYEGHLLHKLICAGGSRWLDGSDRKALRLTRGSRRFLMPEEAVRWDKIANKGNMCYKELDQPLLSPRLFHKALDVSKKTSLVQERHCQ